MKVLSADELIGTDRDVHCPKGGFFSLRFLLKEDNMGYTITRTTVPKGPPQYWYYKNHLESCYCISGYGRLKNLVTLEEHAIQSDTLYVLDKHDPHTFEALTDDVILICVFNPPLAGKEVHGIDGSYGVSP